MPKKTLLRVIDVNFNRSKEGLRVVEDIFRFIFENNVLRKKIRKLRHALTCIANETLLKDAILSRNSKDDIGKDIDDLELKRNDINSILYCNLQRAKESLRVLEEFLKVISFEKVSEIKKIRYKLYQIEKEALKFCSNNDKNN